MNKVRASALLSCSESRSGFGIKSGKTCREDFGDRILALRLGPGNVDLVLGKALEGGEESRFCLRWCLGSGRFPGPFLVVSRRVDCV